MPLPLLAAYSTFAQSCKVAQCIDTPTLTDVQQL
jgi:hypothetical protein